MLVANPFPRDLTMARKPRINREINREITVGVRVNASEAELVRVAAERVGLAVSSYFRAVTIPAARKAQREAQQENGTGKRAAAATRITIMDRESRQR